MIEKIKEKITLENLMCLFILISPLLDILSFLFRNYFETSFSPSTIIRPIIPIICFIILFFKEKNKKQKIMVILIYGIYSLIHMFLFQKLHNQSSYGNLQNEMQYIINYSFMIINLYLFYKIIKNKNKIEKTIFITLLIYIVTLFISIITKTSSSTYLEGIGYKGYFESGNSLCTVLILDLCIILGNTNLKEIKKILLIILTGIYLCVFSGMRTGLFGFSLILSIFILAKFFIVIRDNKKINKKQLIIIVMLIIFSVIALFICGSETLKRRKLLKQNEELGVDLETQEKRYVTGDILNLYKKIKDENVPEEYMSNEEKRAIIDLCEYAEKIKLSNVNLRAQQFLYNIFLVKEQKNILLILFGNGYKNQTGELVMEMETFSLLFNFGLIGFILYFEPFIAIFFISLYKLIKTRKNVNIEYVMYFTGVTVAILLSSFSGYVFFNFSSMTMAIILNVIMLKSFY